MQGQMSEPESLITVPMDALQVGDWFAYCTCGNASDLQQIADDGELAALRQDEADDGPGIVWATFRTLQDARATGIWRHLEGPPRSSARF